VNTMSIKDWADVAESAATIVAMLVAGWWTYRLFIKNRAAYPRASISIETFVLASDTPNRILRVEIAVINDGQVLLPLESLECRLLQITPLVGAVSDRLNEGGPLVLPSEQTVQWPMIDNREWKYAAKTAEVEPGESQTFCSDFLVDQEVSLVEVYCHLSNTSKKSRMGWTRTVFVDLNSPGGVMHQASQREERQLPRAPAPEQAPRRHQVPPTRAPERVPTPQPPPKK
jgi:hypothetical protein